MARQFAVLNPTAKGPTLEIEQGGLVVSSNANSTNIQRMVRGSIGISSGKGFFEVAFYGDGALLDLTAVGIVQGAHSLSMYPGQASTGFGLKVGNGGIFSNNVSVLSTPAVEKKIFIGVLIDISALTCTWYVNGAPFGTVTIPTAKTWYPAITVGNAIAYTMRGFINFGQRAFAWPQDGTVTNSGTPIVGWGVDTGTPRAVFFCPTQHGGFTSGPADDIPLITWEPRILNAEQFTVSRSASVHLWGTQSASATYSSFDVDNVDGSYDFILQEDRRDQTVIVRETTADGSYNSGTTIATAIVDKIVPLGEKAFRVMLKDRMATLQRPLQQRLIPPFADAGVANTPLPITLGACRNVEPVLLDQVNRVYALSDAAITNIAAVRDKGALLDPYAAPPQYVPTNDLQGLILQTLPEGVLTCDVSSEGAQVVIPGAADIFAGGGIFDVWANPALPPTGWTYTGGGTATLIRTAYPAPQNYSASLSTTHAFNPSGGQYGSWLRYDTVPLQPGKTYRIQFQLVRTLGGPSAVIGGMSYGLMVRTDLTTSANGSVTPLQQPIQGPLFGTQGEAYTFTYTCPAGATRKLYFITTSSTISNGNGNGLAVAQFHGVKVELLGDVVQALPLSGMLLKKYYVEILQKRAGLLATDWVPADCDAIDTATGYRFGVHMRDAVTVDQAARAPLDSYCATAFTDNLARIRVRRLVDPYTIADVDLVARFDITNTQYDVMPSTDYATGLTSTIGARRNWKVYTDSDFVSDYIAVPAAMRTQFKRNSQFLQTSVATLANTYRNAANALPLDSMLDDPRQAQLEVDRFIAPYTLGRVTATRKTITTIPRFIEFTVCYEGIPPLLLFGDGIGITYPRFGFDTMGKALVVNTVLNPFDKKLTILAWTTR